MITSLPVNISKVVVLPAPFMPSRPKQSPAGTAHVRPSTARVPVDRPHRPV